MQPRLENWPKLTSRNITGIAARISIKKYGIRKAPNGMNKSCQNLIYEFHKDSLPCSFLTVLNMYKEMSNY